ncbi:MAG: 3'-5' exonuclease [Nocardioides sp.]
MGANSQDVHAEQAQQNAARYDHATGPEASVADKLDALKLLGWRVLTDRRWSGSKRATVDALLVGPGGVVVLDVVGDEADASGDGPAAASVRSMTDRVQDALTAYGVTRQALWSALVVPGRSSDAHTAQVHLVSEDNVATWAASRPVRLEHSEIDEIATLLEDSFPAHDAASPLAARLRADRVDGAQGGSGASLAGALLRAATARPLERWMTYLTPEQLALISTSWDGPARISGAAGTGKTVVGLHRAAYLAERNDDPVLYVAPTQALPSMLSGLCERLAPQVRDSVVFTSLFDLAIAIVEQTRARLHVDARQASIAFISAWMSSGRGGPLSKVDERGSYWQEEIDHVIKARGITDLEEYVALERTGRLAPLDRPEREAMWRLFTEYQRRLAKSKVHDVNDVLVQARDLVREGLVLPSYGAVIADEAQDLPLVGLQLLHVLAGDGPDRLLLIDDGQQAVHPGTCSLAEAGITLAEPVAALTASHRGSADLLRLASEIVADDTHADLLGGVRAHEPGVAIRRRGQQPTHVSLTDRTQLDNALVARLVEICDQGDVGWGDIAVLVQSTAELDHLRTVLMRAALPVVHLQDHLFSGGRIAIATFDATKGLEFDHVLLPGVTDTPARQQGEHDEAYRERVERMRRQQYVAISRTRHGLWVVHLDED